MPYPCDLDHNCRDPTRRKGAFMETNQHAETEAELVTETLVEEVSIDGMCGVY
ncbi:mycofactocin [Mycolicibacterium wolinskyi]|uniref:Mycofactocin n=1 Tax=Mycolicibacterium wolinskyi TaxID=59750 RepID=A0A1X2EZC2_9MYCO|nr:mycofactocin [Mycolicibacterium wolinskyi]